MRLNNYVLLLLTLAGVCCGKRETKHDLGPDSLDELVESRRNLSLRVPDSLECDEEMRVRTDMRGRLFVGLIPDYHIGVFDSAGNLLSVIGRQGFGPGEYMKILDFRVGDDGRVYVMNALTDDLSAYDTNLKLLYSVPTGMKHVMTFDVFQQKIAFLRRHMGRGQSNHLIIASMAGDGRIEAPGLGFLDSGDESIRTYMLTSQTLSTSPEGVVLFAFMSAKVVNVISAEGVLSEIEIDNSTYKVSRTKDLQSRLLETKLGGFMAEVFQNSRVLSIGPISPHHVLLSFATGRFAETKYYVQLYCLLAGSAFTKAYETPFPLYYAGNRTFISRSRPNEKGKDGAKLTSKFTLYKFRSNH